MIERIQYFHGDATRPETTGIRIIAHVCNNQGRWGSGFTLSLSQRWEAPERLYQYWYKIGHYNGIIFGLGNVQFVNVGYGTDKVEDRGIFIANMVAQNGTSDHISICYISLRQCLQTLCNKALNIQSEVILPKIGIERVDGDWGKIEPMIFEELVRKGVVVSVYEFRKLF
jgi:hypothetical protein